MAANGGIQKVRVEPATRSAVDLDSTIVMVIFYLLNDIIVVLIFTMVAEFEPLKVKYCLFNVPMRLMSCVVLT